MKHFRAKRFIRLLILLVIGLGPACSLFDLEEQFDEVLPIGYPSKYYILSPDEHQALQEAYTALNDNQLYATQLDSFGYITRDGMKWRGLAGDICPADEALMISRAKEAVAKFRDFTHVTDATDLRVSSSDGFSGDPGECAGQPAMVYKGWSVHFHNQVYGQMEVLHTGIDVGLDSEGVYWIEGHWYPEITIPLIPLVSSRQARNSIIGTKITWYGFAGEPHIFTVTSGSITGPAERVVLPFQTGSCIELRVVWRIGVEMSSSLSPAWYVYVDTMTGETVETWQLFRT